MSNFYRILDPRECAELLVSRMPEPDKGLYEGYGHTRVEPVFLDRVFYVYRCEGKDPDGKQRPPSIRAIIRVINFSYSVDKGFMVHLLNETTNEKQTLTVKPERIFGYGIFASVPVSLGLRYSQVLLKDNTEVWDTAVVIVLKTANKADFFSKGNYYMEAPKRMAELYPGNDWAPDRQ